MARRNISESCPWARDQGMLGVVENVAPGESVFGFRHTLASASETLSLRTKTNGKVSQMKDDRYRVQVVKEGSEYVTAEAYVDSKTLTGFTLYGDSGGTYSIVVIGRVAF